MKSENALIAPAVVAASAAAPRWRHHDRVGDADHHLRRARDDDRPGEREERAEDGHGPEVCRGAAPPSRARTEGPRASSGSASPPTAPSRPQLPHCVDPSPVQKTTSPVRDAGPGCSVLAARASSPKEKREWTSRRRSRSSAAGSRARGSRASSASTRRARWSSSAAPSARTTRSPAAPPRRSTRGCASCSSRGRCITTFGPYSPGQAVAMKRMGIEGIYLGGWATSAKGSAHEDPGPDLASYPLSQVPDEAAPHRPRPAHRRQEPAPRPRADDRGAAPGHARGRLPALHHRRRRHRPRRRRARPQPDPALRRGGRARATTSRTRSPA